MKSRLVVLAALLGVAFAGSASAITKTTTLGSLSDGDFGVVSNVFFTPTSFVDTINFTLTSTSTISGLVSPARLVDARWMLLSSTGAIAGGLLDFGTYSFADLAPGSYSMSIFGSAQAIAFMAGPIGAAAFAAVSLDLGFVVIGGLFLGLGALLFMALREPASRDEVGETSAG